MTISAPWVMVLNSIPAHIKSAVRKRAIPIHYSSGKDAQGQECWYVFICPYTKLREMQAAETSVKPEEHGYVVASGFGTHPPPFICQNIAQEYGFEIQIPS